MTAPISILTGSGFSVPDGLPTVSQLNQRLSNIQESEIFIGSDQTAFFLNGQLDNNRWEKSDERVFMQDFLEYYRTKVLASPADFHYETFFDFYSGYLRNKTNADAIEAFYQRFNNKLFADGDGSRDCHNRIADFGRSFNQLLGSLLHKPDYLHDVSTLNYPLYETFIQFISTLLQTRNIYFHTLNHDLLFDYVGRHHSDLWQLYSDGFTLWGSPYYGSLFVDHNQGTRHQVKKSYQVKLEYFDDRFDKPLRYYKLHGSINNRIFYTDDGEQVRVKNQYGVSRYSKEVFDAPSNTYQQGGVMDRVDPDFLSGTTTKILHYSGDSYYKKLFDHFQQNLQESSHLVVVGYGFRDSGVNQFLVDHFLKDGKKMIVVDPYYPEKTLIDKYQAVHIKKSVSEISTKQLLDQVDTS